MEADVCVNREKQGAMMGNGGEKSDWADILDFLYRDSATEIA